MLHPKHINFNFDFISSEIMPAEGIVVKSTRKELNNPNAIFLTTQDVAKLRMKKLSKLPKDQT